MYAKNGLSFVTIVTRSQYPDRVVVSIRHEYFLAEAGYLAIRAPYWRIV